MPFVNYVEFSVPDVVAARDFYRSVLDWDPKPFADEYLVVSHGEEPGIDLGMQPMQGDAPSTIAVVTVDSIEETLAKVEKAGGTVIVERFPIPDVGYAAYFVDPTGLQVGLHQASGSQEAR